jgi:PleD family two-component response regulator
MKAVDPVQIDSFDKTFAVSEEKWKKPTEPQLVDASEDHCADTTVHSQQSRELSYLVLVADDDPMIRLLAEQALSNSSFKVVQAKDGKEALEIFTARTPDLLLCDVACIQIC